MSKKIIQHLNPAWAQKSNFIIMANIDDPKSEVEKEQLWARKIDTHRFEVCCIPFFVYNLSLGDEVETDENFTVKKVSKPSGQYTFRVWAKDTPGKVRTSITHYLSANTILWESYSENLFSVSAEDESSAKAVSGYLLELQNNGYIIYETGKL